MRAFWVLKLGLLRSIHRHPMAYTNGAIIVLTIMWVFTAWHFAIAHATLWEPSTGWLGWALTLLVQVLRLFELPWLLTIIGDSCKNRRDLIEEMRDDED